MKEFFHGWRRKAGCITLAVAIAVARIWARSFLVRDHFSIHQSETSKLELILQDGGWWKSSTTKIALDSDRRFFVWSTSPRNDVSDYHLLDEKGGSGLGGCFIEINWRTRFCNGEFGERTITNAGLFGGQTWQQKIWFIPFWWIVAPLTLLSAYLLLWRPRKPESSSILSQCRNSLDLDASQ